jgi:dienelactone hydrolase
MFTTRCSVVLSVCCVAIMGALGACTSSHASTDASQPADGLVVDAHDDTGCAVPGTLVSYERMTTTDTSDTRCDAGQVGSCTIDLEGYLFFPQGASGPLPTIVWNHGSEQNPGPKCTIAEYFVPRGYVVFVPLRRGHTPSTGVYVGSYTAGTKISYLEIQVDDVTTAWNFVKTQTSGSSSVDATRMAIAGHSFGGIETLLTNATALGQRAAIDLCGDSESWGVPENETALRAAIDAAQAPIFFAQPQNDVHIDPTVQYSLEAGTHMQMYQATIYPPVPAAATPQDAHVKFVTNATQVAIWGPGALDFLHRYGM